MQKNYSNDFKLRVVLEALKGDLTIAEIVSRYQISSSVIHKWKKHFLDNAGQVFSQPNGRKSGDSKEVDHLHKTIGRLKVENDFLQEAWSKLKDL